MPGWWWRSSWVDSHLCITRNNLVRAPCVEHAHVSLWPPDRRACLLFLLNLIAELCANAVRRTVNCIAETPHEGYFSSTTIAHQLRGTALWLGFEA